MVLSKIQKSKNEMDKKLINEISRTIQTFNDFLQAHLPALEIEVNSLIESENKDCQLIENYLDSLLSITAHGVADDLFIKLLEYYKSVDIEGAAFYWNEYDKEA